jgi:hypothetical protein
LQIEGLRVLGEPDMSGEFNSSFTLTPGDADSLRLRC